MVFRSSKRNENTSESDTGVTTNRVVDRTATESSSDIGGWSRKATLEETEAHFGMKVPDKDTMFRLQRLEAMNTTERVRGWVDEGMTIEDMGNPLTIEAFRERQAERPPEVPTNIERQNNRSVQRSEKAASKTGQAGEAGVPEPVRDVISSTGRSLDASIQRAMEDRMGDSLGDVQIHTGSQAAVACESINARAFRVGNHIAFNSGEYDPNSAEGQHVLAHELAHVRQQTGGAVSLLPQEDVELEVDPDPALEREAEETAQRVMEGGELGIQRMAQTDVHIQRETDSVQQSLNGEPVDIDNSGRSNRPTTLDAIADRIVDMQEQLDGNTQMAGKALAKARNLERGNSVLEGAAESGIFELVKKGSEMAFTAAATATAGSSTGLPPEQVLAIAGGSAVVQFLTRSASGEFGDEVKEYVDKLDIDLDALKTVLEDGMTGESTREVDY